MPKKLESIILPLIHCDSNYSRNFHWKVSSRNRLGILLILYVYKIHADTRLYYFFNFIPTRIASYIIRNTNTFTF